jgi:hypothetical protein
MNSYIHSYRCGYHHNLIDDVPLAVGIADVDDDHVALYFRILELELNATVVM